MKRLIMIITALALAAVAGSGLAGGDPAAGQTKSMICSACHGADGNSSNGDYPSLAGQVPGYITQQLANFKSGIRSNTIMGGMAQTLTEEDMANLDAWYSSQQPTIFTLAEDQLETAQLGETLYRGGYPPMQVPACMVVIAPLVRAYPPSFPASQASMPNTQRLNSWHSSQDNAGVKSWFRSPLACPQNKFRRLPST